MCVCDLLGVLQASIHSCGKRRQTIIPVKISSQGHLSASHKGGNARAGRAEMEGTGRKERGERGTTGGIDHTAGLTPSLVLSFFFSVFFHTATQGDIVGRSGFEGGGWSGVWAKQSSHTSVLDHCQISQST